MALAVLLGVTQVLSVVLVEVVALVARAPMVNEEERDPFRFAFREVHRAELFRPIQLRELPSITVAVVAVASVSITVQVHRFSARQAVEQVVAGVPITGLLSMVSRRSLAQAQVHPARLTQVAEVGPAQPVIQEIRMA